MESNNITNQEELDKIHSENRNLINEIRKKSLKSKANKGQWLTVVGIIAVFVLTVVCIIAIYDATRPIKANTIDNYININITSTDISINEKVFIGMTCYPGNLSEYPLYVTNDPQGIKLEDNVIAFENKYNNFYYDEENDVYYQLAEIPVGSTVQICSYLQISTKTTNVASNKNLTFSISVEAVEADLSVVAEKWGNVPDEWLNNL